jgi:hypothetical protein
MTDSFFPHALQYLAEHYLFLLAVAIVAVTGTFIGHWLLGLLNDLFAPIRIERNWTTQMKNQAGELVEHESAKLFQFGNRVWGNTIVRATRKRFRVSGFITGPKLCMAYKELGKVKTFDVGAILLVIDEEGNMGGYEIGYSTPDKKVIPREYKWRPNGE